MYEDWSSGESFLQLLKGLLGCWGPGQRLGLVMEQVGEWTGKGAVVLYESAVEVRESQELLEFLDGGRFGPGLDSFHLRRVHPDATTVNMIT